MKSPLMITFNLLFLTQVLPAQTTGMPATGSVWDDPMILFYAVIGFILIVAVLILVVAVNLLQVISLLTKRAALENAKRKGIAYVEDAGFWSKFFQWTNKSVPIEKEETIMLDHNYDGIRELDNYLPPWWKYLFYGSIIWGGVYLVVYHITGTLPLQTSEYEAEVTLANEQMLKRQAANPGPKIDEATVEVTTDVKALEDGKSTFTSICASCHKPDGGGSIGPNLTDQYWKHGGSIKDIFKVVAKGVANTNMVAWGTSLSPEKIRNVSSYLLTLQGTNPPGAKKPEGTLYTPEPAKPAADTVKTQASVK